MRMCVSVCGYEYMRAGVPRRQRCWIILYLELWRGVNVQGGCWESNSRTLKEQGMLSFLFRLTYFILSVWVFCLHVSLGTMHVPGT